MAPVTFTAAPAEAAAPPRWLAGRTIGVARDAAFSFLYQANLDLLERMGASLRFFSPLEDPALRPAMPLVAGGLSRVAWRAVGGQCRFA